MAKITTTTEAFIVKLQALYDVEKELEKALPKMEKAASDPKLKEGFRLHLEETQDQVKRLEEIFEELDVKPKKLTSAGIRGIIEDSAWVMKVDAPEILKDAMIAGAARTAEHYEISLYVVAIEEARALGLSNPADLLSESLEEEESADESLAMALQENLEMM